MKGIRTIDDLKLRCVLDDETGCWIWRGAKSESDAYPQVYVAAIGRTLSAGSAIGYLLTGKRERCDFVWLRTCDTGLCANPDHRRRGTRTAAQARIKGVPMPQLQRERITAAMRAKGKLTPEIADEMRASAESDVVLAKRYGCSRSLCRKVRTGIAWKAAPVSSVFGWRP